MKKVLIIIFSIILLAGCSIKSSNSEYSGKVTDLSKQCLSGGNTINIFRSYEELGDDVENYGKAYVTMTFNVVTNIKCNIDYNNTNEYIKQKKISNIHIIKTPKMGVAEEIYPNFGISDSGDELKGSNNSYITNYDNPLNYVNQSSIAVKVNKIALYDVTNYDYNAEPSTSKIYSDLGITRDGVALTLGFRIELTLVNGKILYKDFEVEMPPSEYDISGTEYQIDNTISDTINMEAFLEKQ